MTLASIWRYPVKSMAGESLEATTLTSSGVHGDRVVQVYDRHARLVTSRTRPALLGHRAMLGSDDEPTIDGHRWSSSEARRIVEHAAGDGAHLKALDDYRFDILPLLVATDGAVDAFGRDVRRLRPNILIAGVHALDERSWEGRRLRIGGAVVQLENLRGRCVMTTFDPDTQKQDAGVLRDIARRFGGTFCLNASVVTGAPVRVGDAVTLL